MKFFRGKKLILAGVIAILLISGIGVNVYRIDNANAAMSLEEAQQMYRDTFRDASGKGKEPPIGATAEQLEKVITGAMGSAKVKPEDPSSKGFPSEGMTETRGIKGSDVGNEADLSYITTIFTSITAFFFMLSAWIMSYVFGLSTVEQITGLKAVQIGGGIVLGITNLGFVLAIIVIAFATIFRRETYAMKQTLWKLIIAALLVNFSVVIAGAFISISDTVSGVFLQGIGITKNGGFWSGTGDLSTKMASYLQASQLMEVEDAGLSTLVSASKMLKFVAGLIFIVAFTVLAIISFLAIAIMLLIRFIALAILLILSPIVWLMWIFPYTQQWWQKWWQEFLRWTFFAPIVFFFIYLAMATMEQGGVPSAGGNQDNVAGIEEGLKNMSFVPAENISQALASMIILMGLLYGGLYAANSLGIAGAQMGMNLAQRAGKGTGQWAGRKGLRAATSPARSKWGQKAIEGMQKTPGLRRIGHALSNVGARQGENLIKQAEERQKGFSDKQLALRVATMSREERVSALSRLAKNKNLNMVPNISQHIANAGTQKLFESYGQGLAYKNLEKTFGANTAMLTGKDEKGNSVDRNEAAQEFFAKFSKTDWAKMQFNDVYSKESKFGLDPTAHKLLQEVVTNGIVINNPGDVRKILVNVKSENFGNTHSLITRVNSDIRARGDEKSIDIADKVTKALGNTLGKRLTGELLEYPEVGAT